MIDEVYRNSFKEVYDILGNTEKELVEKIPEHFMNLLKENMNENYKTNIRTDVDIDKQKLSKETEAILALIYRSYWATDEEKNEVKEKEIKEKIEQQRKYQENLKETFEKNKNINNITVDKNLMVIKKENFIKRILNKIWRKLTNKN